MSAPDGCPVEAASPPGPGDRVQCWPLPAVAQGPGLSLTELASVAGEFAFQQPPSAMVVGFLSVSRMVWVKHAMPCQNCFQNFTPIRE